MPSLRTVFPVILVAAIGCESSADEHFQETTGGAGGAAISPAAADGGRRRGAANEADASVAPNAPARQDGGGQASTTCSFSEPPPIVMTAAGAEQPGITGSFCASGAGCNAGLCADRGTAPRVYTVVHPRDEVVFSMPAGTLMGGGSACMPACAPTVQITETCRGKSRNVDRRLKGVPFQEDQPWTISLPTGLYVLTADAHFVGDDGSSGSTTSLFGIIVDAERERGPAQPDDAVEDCAQATERDADAGA